MSYLSIPVLDVAGPPDDPAGGVQYAVFDPATKTHSAYGDQDWVASGRAVQDAHPNGRVQRRTVTVTYGEWEDVP